jgi:diacylglycerol kinase (ATP)
MRRATVVVNPIAGRRRGRPSAARLVGALRQEGWTVSVRETEGPGHAAQLAAASAPEADLVIVAGGDGTVSEALAGLRPIPSPPPLAMLPVGTGNDIAAALGMVGGTDGVIRQVIAGRPCRLDCGLLARGGPFLSVVGVGFDARVAERLVGRRRLLAGRAAYTHCVLQELLGLAPVLARTQVDDQVVEGEMLLVAIANTPSYGGGMRIAPQADPTDGQLDVTVITRVGRLRFLGSFPRVFAGTHTGLPEVRLLRGTQVRIETAEPGPVLVDGDLRGQTPIEARVAPRGALLWVPPGSPWAAASGPEPAPG